MTTIRKLELELGKHGIPLHMLDWAMDHLGIEKLTRLSDIHFPTDPLVPEETYIDLRTGQLYTGIGYVPMNAVVANWNEVRPVMH